MARQRVVAAKQQRLETAEQLHRAAARHAAPTTQVRIDVACCCGRACCCG